MSKISIAKRIDRGCRTRSVIGLCLTASLALTACGGGVPALDLLSNSSVPYKDQRDTAASAACQVAPAMPTLPKSGLVRVTDYGAKPDDAIDDTAAIQRAMDDARPGDWVVFPPGRYLQSATLRLTRPQITLWGEGATVHATAPADQAIVLQADETRMYGFTLTATGDVRTAPAEASRIVAFGGTAPGNYIRGVVIQNNRIVPLTEAAGTPTSNSTSGAGILLIAVRDFSVANNVVRRTLSDGIHITGGSRNGRVVGNQVSQTGDDMIAVVSYIEADWETRAMQSLAWLKEHQASTRVQDVWVSDNVVSDPYWGRGLAVVGGERISFVNNQVSRSTVAAGILVARDAGYVTHGVSDVLVQGNTITDVQTTSPAYLPEGPTYTELRDKLRLAPRTGHGGIEIHNVTDPSQMTNAIHRMAVGISGVTVVGNTVQRAGRDGIRLGADSLTGSILDVQLVNNSVFDAALQSYQNNLLGDVEVPLACSGNKAQGEGVTPKGCVSEVTSARVAGAALSCSRFPSP